MFYRNFSDKIKANENLGMSVLQNEDKKNGNNINRDEIYELPAVIRDERDDISFAKAFIFSFVLHPIIVIAVLLISLILRYLGINFDLFKLTKPFKPLSVYSTLKSKFPLISLK